MSEIDPVLANEMETGEPIPGFPVKFSWHKNYWFDLFQEQVELIQRDIRRARADGKLIVYLSCPISARGGGDQSTNVEIAKGVERRLLSQWGERFWILNPAQYQMESKEGSGLIQHHAKALNLDLDKLKALTTDHRPSGGDYMRMWTRVLVEDAPYFDDQVPSGLKNTGQHFDAFYFLGPKDIYDFFAKGGETTLTAGIEGHFARKFATDPDFRDTYSSNVIVWRNGWQDDKNLTREDRQLQQSARHQWADLRRQYVRFYALRASINFSLGSHDEWEIFRQINLLRRKALEKGDNLGVAEQLGGFFDQSQIDPAAAEAPLSRGYAVQLPAQAPSPAGLAERGS
jgi:hypothetical protein